MQLFVADNKRGNDANNGINTGQQKLQAHNIADVFTKQLAVLGNVFIVVAGDAQIEQDVQEHGKVQEREIQSVTFVAHHILNSEVDSEYPERFD